MTAPSYNTRSAGVRRLMQEAKELKDPTEMYHAQPTEENLFEWHFTVRGPAESDFEGGVYHGRLLFPTDYPMKPPNIILLTPNGRFQEERKICLSISGYHPETWLPSWSIRTALLAIIGFMPTKSGGAIGAVSYPSEERKKLAKKSLDWRCDTCKITMKEVLKPLSDEGRKEESEARSLIKETEGGVEEVSEVRVGGNGEGDGLPTEAVAVSADAIETPTQSTAGTATAEAPTNNRPSPAVFPVAAPRAVVSPAARPQPVQPSLSIFSIHFDRPTIIMSSFAALFFAIFWGLLLRRIFMPSPATN